MAVGRIPFQDDLVTAVAVQIGRARIIGGVAERLAGRGDAVGGGREGDGEKGFVPHHGGGGGALVADPLHRIAAGGAAFLVHEGSGFADAAVMDRLAVAQQAETDGGGIIGQ